MIKVIRVPGLGLFMEISLSSSPLSIFGSKNNKCVSLLFDNPFEKEIEFVAPFNDEFKTSIKSSFSDPDLIAFLSEVSEIPEVKKIITEKDGFLTIHSDQEFTDEVICRIGVIHHSFIDGCKECKERYLMDKEAINSATKY